MGKSNLWLFLAAERCFVVFVASFMCRLLSLSIGSRCLHPRCAPASEDPACESLDTNVTCWGDGELQSIHIQESGFYQLYTHAKVEEGITAIGLLCFHGCSRLCSIDLPTSVVEYKGGAFQGTAITTFLVGKSVKTLNSGVWNGCGYLTHLYVESGNTILTASDGFLFQNGNLYSVGAGRGRDTNLTLPDCTTILASAMRWNFCTELVISDKTTTIQSDAFYASRFTKVTLGKKVTSIDSKAFSRCNNLQTIDLNGNNNFYLSSGQFGAKNTAGNPTSIVWVSLDITSMIIAKTVTAIGVPLIQRCENLSSISVASGNTQFGVACSNQLVVDTKSNNKWTRACHCVGGATSIEVPSNIVTIAYGCFWQCNLLTELIFHSGLNCFGDSICRECANLVSIDFKGCTMKLSNGNALTTTNMAVSSPKLRTIVSWPSNNFGIDVSSFGSCGFTFLQLPDQCISIGMQSFESCSQLETVIIPKTTTSIGMQSFYNCKLLRNVTFAAGSTLTQLSGLSFGQCTSLNTITLPSTITDMTANCFGYDSNLTVIKFTSDTPTFATYSGAVYKKSGSNKHYTFYICPSGVSAVILNDDTIEIGSNSFYGCTKLRDVIMNNKLTKLSTNAFTQCDMIEFIRIPGTVTSIGKRVFVLCPKLKRVLYCSDNDSIECDGDPFPSNPAIYLLYGSESTCNFAGHECERILDSECNIPTNAFTRAPVTTLVNRRLYIYSCMCLYVTNDVFTL